MIATGKRYLIVNADDFGRSPGVNWGVIEAHEHGIVTSASLMVRWPAAADAAAYGARHPELSLGLHLDLGTWRYRANRWVPIYEVVPTDDAGAIRRELAAQLAAFRRLTGRDPSHIDSHQHVHQRQPTQSVMIEIAEKLRLPLRHFSREVHYRGNFYGQTAEGSPLPDQITVDALIRMLSSLPTGVTELGCHPGFATDIDTMYRDERAVEVKVLCDRRIRTAMDHFGVELCSFDSIVNPRSRSREEKAVVLSTRS